MAKIQVLQAVFPFVYSLRNADDRHDSMLIATWLPPPLGAKKIGYRSLLATYSNYCPENKWQKSTLCELFWICKLNTEQHSQSNPNVVKKTQKISLQCRLQKPKPCELFWICICKKNKIFPVIFLMCYLSIFYTFFLADSLSVQLVVSTHCTA